MSTDLPSELEKLQQNSKKTHIFPGYCNPPQLRVTFSFLGSVRVPGNNIASRRVQHTFANDIALLELAVFYSEFELDFREIMKFPDCS